MHPTTSLGLRQLSTTLDRTYAQSLHDFCLTHVKAETVVDLLIPRLYERLGLTVRPTTTKTQDALLYMRSYQRKVYGMPSTVLARKKAKKITVAKSQRGLNGKFLPKDHPFFFAQNARMNITNNLYVRGAGPQRLSNGQQKPRTNADFIHADGMTTLQRAKYGSLESLREKFDSAGLPRA